MEIDILATLEENFEKCPTPWPIPGYAPGILAKLSLVCVAFCDSVLNPNLTAI